MCTTNKAGGNLVRRELRSYELTMADETGAKVEENAKSESLNGKV